MFRQENPNQTTLVLGLGIALEGPSAWQAARVRFLALVLIGFIPLLAFVVHLFAPTWVGEPFLWSVALTGIAFFGIGAAKGVFIEHPWYWSGLETLSAGRLAAGLAFLVARLLRGLVQ